MICDCSFFFFFCCLFTTYVRGEGNCLSSWSRLIHIACSGSIFISTGPDGISGPLITKWVSTFVFFHNCCSEGERVGKMCISYRSVTCLVHTCTFVLTHMLLFKHTVGEKTFAEKWSKTYFLKSEFSSPPLFTEIQSVSAHYVNGLFRTTFDNSEAEVSGVDGAEIRRFF